MAKMDYIFQGLNNTDDHLSAFSKLNEIPNIKKIVLSVAFVRTSGLDLIDDFITAHAKKIEFFIGIRNGITSVQSIFRILNKKIIPTVVDTASQSLIFHPKVYLSQSDRQARVIVGSSNLTEGGLVRNLEASTLIDIDLTSDTEKEYFNKITSSIYTLKHNYPQNVFQIKNHRHAVELFQEGRLIDERISTNLNITGRISRDKKNDIDKLVLNTRRIKSKPITIRRKPKSPKISSVKLSRSGWLLLWESKPLTERDLNIPSGRTTHSTGSMTLKKGNMQGIDQRHHFRDEIFKDLIWKPDPGRSHLERTNTNFELVIKGISYGVFDLHLTHNTDTTSESYLQRNSMSHLHWGDAKKYIANRNLLKCTLRLYKPINSEDTYVIEIT